jgi:hypothetical protein
MQFSEKTLPCFKPQVRGGNVSGFGAEEALAHGDDVDQVVHEQVVHLDRKEADVILVGPGLLPTLVVADMQHDQVVLDLDEYMTHMLGIVPGQEQFRLS